MMSRLRLAGVVLSVLAILFLGVERNALAETAANVPLIAATLAGDAAEVRRTLAAGADPNATDDNRNTALIFAARDGHADIAAILIAGGADPGWVDGEQVTPLILASFQNRVEIVRLLLAEGVDRDHKDQWGRTAFDYARRRGINDAIYRLLTQP